MDIITFELLEDTLPFTKEQLNLFLSQKLEITQSAISQWRSTGIPADRQLEILDRVFSISETIMNRLIRDYKNIRYYYNARSWLFKKLPYSSSIVAEYIKNNLHSGKFTISRSNIVKDLGIHLNNVNRAIYSLEKLGIITSEKQGKQKHLIWNYDTEKKIKEECL